MSSESWLHSTDVSHRQQWNRNVADLSHCSDSMRGDKGAVASGAVTEQDKAGEVEAVPAGRLTLRLNERERCDHVVACPGPSSAVVVAAPILDLDDCVGFRCERAGQGRHGGVVDPVLVFPVPSVNEDNCCDAARISRRKVEPNELCRILTVREVHYPWLCAREKSH